MSCTPESRISRICAFLLCLLNKIERNEQVIRYKTHQKVAFVEAPLCRVSWLLILLRCYKK